MIPKIIHYCWFGRNPLPPLAVKCITSWKKYFPDYEIKEWNEDNFDINILKEMLIKKFNEIDYNEAKEDVLPFTKDASSLDLWSKDFFITITDKLN